MYYTDWTYLILVLPAVILALWASVHVKTTFRRYAKLPNHHGMTGAEAARRILDANGLYQVPILPTGGELTDHYDPRNKTLYLSQSVYGEKSCAAVGVACHEVGHAVQDAENYAPLRIRNSIVSATNIGSRLAIPLVILGLVLSSLSYYGIYIAYAGVACFGLSALFQLVTLPTEFNASARAQKSLAENHILDDEELKASSKVLRAAALTYVAALAVSLMQLLRLLLLVSGSTGRRRR